MKNSNFRVEKSGRYHLNQVTKLKSPVKKKSVSVPYDVMQWEWHKTSLNHE